MEIIKLYENGKPLEELNKFEQLAFDIIKSAISNVDFDITEAIETKPFENWGKWLQRLELKVSIKQLNILSRNLAFKKLCFSEDKKIFANMEFSNFTGSKYGNSYGVVQVNIFQINPTFKPVVEEN